MITDRFENKMNSPMLNYFVQQFFKNAKKLIDYQFFVNTDQFENIINEFPDVDYICAVHTDDESRNVENVSNIPNFSSGYSLAVCMSVCLFDILILVCSHENASGHNKFAYAQ